jgi:hypothetical protein
MTLGLRALTEEDQSMPQITEIPPIAAAVTSLSVGKAITYGAVTVLPLHRANDAEPGWLTLAEAGDAVTISEVSEAGAVPTLTVKNDADRAVLLLDGEQLIGAKQNRILNTTVLVAAKSTTAIPVSCVEAGRWSYRGRRFSSSDYALYASIRQKKTARVSQSLREQGRHDAGQSEVWDELAQKAAFLRTESPTAAMHDVYERYAEDVKASCETFAPVADQVGALVYVAGEWAGLELFAGPTLFSKAWPRLSTGYVADGLGRDATDELRVTPKAVVTTVMAMAAETAPAVGLGTEYRLNGKAAIGATLVADDVVAHLAAFPAVVD